jgi:predicted MFS family arabinose efflux permease
VHQDFLCVTDFIVGEAVGALTQTAIGDKLGRIRFMQLACIVVTIGVVIQTASVNMGMFLAGRALAGMAVGGMVSYLLDAMVSLLTNNIRSAPFQSISARLRSPVIEVSLPE